MTRLLISTAFAGLLAFSGGALAQGRDDNRQNGGDRHEQSAPAQAAAQRAAPQQASRPAPTPGSRPGGAYGRGYVPAPAAQSAPAPAAPAPARNAQSGGGQGAQGNNAPRAQDNNNRGPDNRGQNSGNDRRGQDNNNNQRGQNDDRRGTGFNNDRRGPGANNDRRDFSSYHRTFNAPRRYRAPAYRRPSGWYYNRWTFGQILPSIFWSQDYWMSDYFDYGLEPPPPGTVWVRDGSDALLIDRYSGEIIQVAYDVFY